MEYFNFDEASYGSYARDDDVASDHREFDENDDAAANHELLSLEQPLEFSNDPPEQPLPDCTRREPIDPWIDNRVYPMFRAKDPCDFCRHMGLDCFVAKSGVMQNSGCTCCITLYRECSFTHAKAPGKFLSTFPPINENVDIPFGGLSGKKALKSLTGMATAEEIEGRSRKSSSRLSREAVRILKTWLQEHHEHPYPNDQEKDDLKQRTGLKRTQICNWLANARRRGKVRPPPRSGSPVPGAVDVPGQSHLNMALMTPLERWKHSPPENEPAATSDILRALERRRRRKASAPINTFNQHKARGSRIYQCTFCADSFQTKYDWQRHEKSLHLALEKWTCSPHGGVTIVDNVRRCVFCMAADPDHDHLESHNYSSCQEKSLTERSFYRKDHLNQHLRLMHNVRFHPTMDKWRSNICEIRSRCGFCGTVLTTWKDRTDHLASHFKSGADMAQWHGDWGFEPEVESLVENAMPPYLIGHEHTVLDPFKTSVNLANPEDVNCFRRLQAQLTSYIHNQMAAGVFPTDQMIQNEARQVIYGNDDPWNQTCADNPVWLSVLKRDAGLEAVPGSEHIRLENLGMRPPFAAQDGLRQPPVETNLSARSLCRRYPLSSGYSSPSIHSPAFPGTGRSSAVPSMPGSSTGSFVGSTGMLARAPNSGLSTDWGSSVSAGVSSFSTPAGSVDPFVQMGFDPEFLQRLNDNYDKLDLGDLQGLAFDGGGGHGGGGFEPAADAGVMGEPIKDAMLDSNTGTAPIPIPSPKNTDTLMADAGLPREMHHSGGNYPGGGGI
ncbi:hypothetical protein BJX96DRAFT_166424 [Aspergillus floccosus]